MRDARAIGGSVSTADYPQSAARAGIGGSTAVRVHVNERGRIDACEVTQSSRSGALDSAVCRLLGRRFRFDPARDRAGRPVPQWLVSRWTFRPPNGISIESPSAEPGPQP